MFPYVPGHPVVVQTPISGKRVGDSVAAVVPTTVAVVDPAILFQVTTAAVFIVGAGQVCGGFAQLELAAATNQHGRFVPEAVQQKRREQQNQTGVRSPRRVDNPSGKGWVFIRVLTATMSVYTSHSEIVMGDV